MLLYQPSLSNTELPVRGELFIFLTLIVLCSAITPPHGISDFVSVDQ